MRYPHGWLGLNKLRCNYCTWHQADLDFSIHYIILGQLAWTRPGESAWVAGGSWGTVDGRGMADLSCLSLGLRGNEVADKWLAPSFTHNHPFPRLSGWAWNKFLFLGKESCSAAHWLRRVAPRASGKHQAPEWPDHQPMSNRTPAYTAAIHWPHCWTLRHWIIQCPSIIDPSTSVYH